MKIRDLENENLHKLINEARNSLTEEPFIYKPFRDDPIDSKLANFINKKSLKLRSRMLFERESQGVYRYNRKRVFMKLEKETIVIRVGGGFLTIDEFVQIYCGGVEEQRKRITNMVYAGSCQGNKNYKAFYFSQQQKETAEKEEHSAPNQVLSKPYTLTIEEGTSPKKEKLAI